MSDRTDALLAQIAAKLGRIEALLSTQPTRPVTTWQAESHTAYRGPAGEYRVGWQTPPHGHMHGEWVHR